MLYMNDFVMEIMDSYSDSNDNTAKKKKSSITVDAASMLG
jgi:hypothetical protein